MEYLIGLFLSLAVAGLAIIGLDQERAFYPTVLIVIASYYVLFAVMAASGRTLVIEIAVASDFFAACHNGLQEKSLVSSHRPCWAPFDVDSRRLFAARLLRSRLATR